MVLIVVFGTAVPAAVPLSGRGARSVLSPSLPLLPGGAPVGDVGLGLVRIGSGSGLAATTAEPALCAVLFTVNDGLAPPVTLLTAAAGPAAGAAEASAGPPVVLRP